MTNVINACGPRAPLDPRLWRGCAIALRDAFYHKFIFFTDNFLAFPALRLYTIIMKPRAYGLPPLRSSAGAALLAALVCASPALAGSGRLNLPKSSSKAEYRLSAWLDREPVIWQKLSLAQEQPAPATAQTFYPRTHPDFAFADPSLKDAVADIPAQNDTERELCALLARLPGMPTWPAQGCRSYPDCDVPPLALDIEANEPMQPAIRALLRPWLWLAEARGRRLSVAASPETLGKGQRLLDMSLKDFGLEKVGLRIMPRPEGGFHLWFDRGFELAEVYSRERNLILPR